MADNARGIHVSPGIYTREVDLNYAVRSLGITTLGVAGETLRGPAFQPMDIANWREFQEMFGGTSTERFKGSKYPKYELPYIAKSYLTESEQLKVVRVLGLSGYNAGPAWLVTASGDDAAGHQAVVLLRSRGGYKLYQTGSTENCACQPSKYDKLSFYVGEPTLNSTCQKNDYNMNALQIKPYTPIDDIGDECAGYTLDGGDSNWAITQYNHGRFTLVGITGENTSEQVTQAVASEDWDFVYPVSLNPNDKDYILKVLGTKPDDGETFIYVESLYDIALDQGIAAGELDKIDSGETGTDETSGLKAFRVFYTADYCHHTPVNSIMEIPNTTLKRKHVGMRFLANADAASDDIRCVAYDYKTGKPVTLIDVTNGKQDVIGSDEAAGNVKNKTLPKHLQGDNADEEDRKAYSASTLAEYTVKAGQIYTVKQFTTLDGKRHYVYAYYTTTSVNAYINDHVAKNKGNLDPTNLYGNLLDGGTKGMDNCTKLQEINAEKKFAQLVLNLSDGYYYRMNDGDIDYVTLDLNDYKSAYKYASTPWIVSNLKGDYNHIELNKMFRFHTISDGSSSNYEIKVSIENIRPDEGTFDVNVRKIDDVDESIITLERFNKCNMIPGDANYIAYRIGSFDGIYESKSKFIVVEVNETTAAKNSVPCGFLGYPIPKYDGLPISGDPISVVKFPVLQYNRNFNEDVKNRKQYFGLSSWVGVDIDNFTFKGTKSYIDRPDFYTRGFHLDSRLDEHNGGIKEENVYVDGISGYTFDCVSTDARTQILDGIPMIGKENEMYGSIYEYVNLRKFTVYFYGGFDGWDEYRDERTNTDSFKMTQYRGFIDEGSGEGYSFNKIINPESLGLNQNGITSDWYAYLSAIRQFAVPEATDINVFATPGIDYVNQKLLVNETIEMIEEERADSIYVVTTPDKPSGAGDYIDEMYTPEDAVDNLEDSEIDSNYTCTYYPWVKYMDVDNNQYIYLPATKDAVRNFAQTDNVSFPWFAPAGISRGDIDCVRAHYITKLADEDILYNGRINPVKTFAQEGPKIWGQKNLQINETQLNRIAVRRLLLRIRKLIAISCIGLIFEPNDATTKQSFISTVTPILDAIRSNRGISDYRIEVNDSLESRERRELPAKIFYKPINALEYICIDLILTPEGVSFDDI